ELAPMRSHGGLGDWPAPPVSGWTGPGEADWWSKMLGRPVSDAVNAA
ncbi:MAG: hypothetical protein QOE36_3347, partial [Gaiellaceae bacterium]|nr:hypothetical protein [Gaiellaceae bacterium]